MMYKKILMSLFMASVFFSSYNIADDTELYVVDASSYSGKRPQVLFIFDNSGSMNEEDQNSVSPYCSESDYLAGKCSYPEGFAEYAAGYSGYINEKGTYWNAGGVDNSSTMPVPERPNDSRRFYKDNNNCHKAAIALETRGRYTGYLREFKKNGNTGTWVSLAENNGFNTGQIVDCYQDVFESDPNNPGKKKQGSNMLDFPLGYPVNTKNMYTLGSDEAARQESIASVKFGSGVPVTLYSAHYLVWYKWVTTTEEGKNSGGTGTRLDVAKNALKDTLASVSLSIPIDAGLAIFNLDFPSEGDADGGRIIYDIKEMTEANKASLFSLIDGVPAKTNTPLCETLYEAYHYFSGGPVTFGNDDENKTSGNDKYDYTPNVPPSILSSGSYSTPFKKCPDTAYVIYITDGAPTLDRSADSAIAALGANGNPAGNYQPFTFTDVQGDEDTSYLPALASYMYHNDLVKGVTDSLGTDNKQNVRLFTIGFSDGADDAAALLEEAAYRGGNERKNGVSKGYYVAKTGLDLVEAIDDALKSILATNSSFTSPSIASNNFDKTQTYNSAYFAMFLPSEGPRWSGNLKKLKVTSSGEIVAPGGTERAIDASGNIAATTCTYWNACSAAGADGNKVKSGGVLPALRKTLKSRKIYTGSSSLTNIANVSESTLASDMGIASADVTTHINWLYGVDVDDDDNDGSRTDAREDIMGDPLHSKPLAINFGPSSTNLDVRIIVGTNQGLVHMFKDSDSGSSDYAVGEVSESWAFIPKELLSNIPTLKENNPVGGHSVYGMDLSPVAYTETDSSGAVNKAWLYLGMRRGGSSYYALDITNPDNPSFKWKIDTNTSGLEDLGDTWSEPLVTFIPGVESPVLIFGGGMATSDGTGQAVYIVNADTGAFIKKFTASDMDSVASRVAVLDSNNDGISDRIYASDIGGSVWRIDLPSSDTASWSTFKFASISTGSSPNNRMFFAEPTVAQTQFSNIHKVTTTIDGESTSTITYQTTAYDAVTIGSGDRTRPSSDKVTNDMFYVFQDRNIVTQTFSGADVPATLGIADLYDVTATAPVTESENLDFGGKRGWYYNLSMTGEKSLSASLIFDGKVYFTSFVPPTNTKIDIDAGVCGFLGQGRLYVFDLHKGTRTYSHLYYEIGSRVPDTPQIVVPEPEEGKESKAYIIGVGKGECVGGDCKGTIELGGGLETNRIYYHLDENN